MSLANEILAALVQYGLPALFVVVLAASTGIPLPASLLLVAAGSFVQQGSFSYWPVVGLGITAAVLGDQVGYFVGRWGGQWLNRQLARWAGGAARLAAADQAARRWGGLGIFLSRWLLTPVGPAVNLSSGLAAYSWLHFFWYDLAGEVLWVNGYVSIGRIFSDRVQAMSSLLGDLGWASVAFVLAVILGWLFVRSLRRSRSGAQVSAEIRSADAPQHSISDG
jgi:membrane protein DedA with SNARE-associated domain